MTQPPDAAGFSAAQAGDPATDAQTLADIAYRRPDLRSVVASNPAAYPGLLQWLGALQDPQVDAALAARATAGTAPTSSAAAADPSAGAYGPDGQFAGGVAPGPGTPDTPIAPRRSRAGVWIGLAAAVVLLVGGGVFAANKLWFSKVDGASSPTAAVEHLTDGLVDGDMVKVYGATSPAEVDDFTESSDLFSTYFKDVDGFNDIAKDIDPHEFADVFSVTTSGIELTSDQLDKVTSRVTFTAGTLTLDVSDPDKVIDLVKHYATTAKKIADSFDADTSVENFGIDPDDEAQIRSTLEKTFPVTVTIDDGTLSYSTSSGDESGSSETPISVISVQEDGDWYVSPLLTMTDYAMGDTSEPRGSLEGIDDVEGADSATAAGEAFVDGIFAGLKKGDIKSIGNVLPLAERRVFAFAAGAADTSAAEQAASQALSAVDAPELTFDERRHDGDYAWLELSSFSMKVPAGSSADGDVTVKMSDGCLNVTGLPDAICLSDSPGFAALGIDQLSLVAVHEKTGWFASPILSLADGYGLVFSKVVSLAQSGDLTPQWFQDNFGGLTSLFGGMAGLPGGLDATGDDLWSDSGSADSGGDAGPGVLSGTDEDEATDPGDADSGGKSSSANSQAVVGELQDAIPAVKSYLKDHPQADFSSIDKKKLDKYGFTDPGGDFYLSVSSLYSGSDKDFCVTGLVGNGEHIPSVSSTGDVFKGPYCLE